MTHTQVASSPCARTSGAELDRREWLVAGCAKGENSLRPSLADRADGERQHFEGRLGAQRAITVEDLAGREDAQQDLVSAGSVADHAGGAVGDDVGAARLGFDAFAWPQAELLEFP